MSKIVWIGLLCFSVTYAYVLRDTARYGELEKAGEKLYYGDGVKQDFRKAKEKLKVSCSVGYVKSCELLSDIYAGVTPELKKRQKPYRAKLDLSKIRQADTKSFYYFPGFSPFEMLIKQIEIPESGRWRIHMKLYPLKHAELNEYSQYLVVADVIEKINEEVKITRYSTVYKLIPMADGARYNDYISKNDISGAQYGCLVYNHCSDLDEVMDEKIIHDNKETVVIEKAPWDKEPVYPAALVRAMEYFFFNLKKLNPIEVNGEAILQREWRILHDIPKRLSSRPFQTLVIDKMGTEYQLLMGKYFQKDYWALSLFVYDSEKKKVIRTAEGKLVK